MEFRPKIPRNKLGTVSVNPRKQVLIPRYSEVYGIVNSEARNGMEWHEKNSFLQKILVQQTELTACSPLRHTSERNSERFASIFFFFRVFAGLVQLLFRGAIHPRILVGPPVGCSSTLDDPILEVLGRGFEPRATLQQPGALSTGPCPTPNWTMPHPIFLLFLSMLLFLFHWTEFWVGFSSEEWFGTEFQLFAPIFVPRNGIPNCFLFRGMVQNGIPRVCFYFCSTAQNSWHFFPLWNGSERNFESFLFRRTAGIPPEQINSSVYSVFRGIIFCRKLPTLVWTELFSSYVPITYVHTLRSIFSDGQRMRGSFFLTKTVALWYTDENETTYRGAWRKVSLRWSQVKDTCTLWLKLPPLAF